MDPRKRAISMNGVLCLCLSLFVVLLSSCSKQTSDSLNVWGTDFTFTPLHQASSEEREIGRAIVYIRRAEGGTGAGFFISPDGLFITNEHVLPRNRCSADRCSGVQLIRNMTPGGDFEAFDQIKLLAANSNPELDFAIGKVVSKNPVHVPYLKLANENSANESNLSASRLELFGHPFGASIQLISAKFLYAFGTSIQLRSPLLPGNSGGPVVNMENHTVVGLVSASLFHVETADRVTGAFEHSTQAIDIGAIRDSLSAVFPRLRDSEEWTTAMFEKPEMERPGMYRDLLPLPRANFSKTEPAIAPFFGQLLGASDEKTAFNNLIIFFSDLAGRSSQAGNFARTLTSVSLERGLNPANKFDISKLIPLITDKNQKDQQATRIAIEVLSGSMTKNECLSKNSGEPNTLKALHYAMFTCLSLKMHDDRPALDVLSDFYKTYRSRVDSDPRLQSYVLSLLDRHLWLETPSTSNVSQIVDILRHIEASSHAKGIELEAEGTRTLLEKDPRIISSGAFRNTF